MEVKYLILGYVWFLTFLCLIVILFSKKIFTELKNLEELLIQTNKDVVLNIYPTLEDLSYSTNFLSKILTIETNSLRGFYSSSQDFAKEAFDNLNPFKKALFGYYTLKKLRKLLKKKY